MRPLCGLVALLCVAPLGGARVRFCCKTELGANALGDPACGRQDLVFVGQRFGPRPWSPAQVAELAVSAGTNVLFLVPLRLLAARGRVADACSCAGLVVASTAYHWCDVRGTLCANQIFNPTSMCAYSNVLTQALPPCFENSLRAIDSSKNQPNRLRFDRAREF